MRIKTELIDEYLLSNKLTKTKFCKMCGISYKSLKKIYNQNFSVFNITIFKIIKVIKVQPKIFFEN